MSAICSCRNVSTMIQEFDQFDEILTHWGQVTHICVVKLTIISSDNGLSPERRQAIIWTNAGILLIGPLGTNFSEMLIEIQTFPLKKIHLKMSFAKCCSCRLSLNVLITKLATIGTASEENLIKMTTFPVQLNVAVLGTSNYLSMWFLAPQPVSN